MSAGHQQGGWLCSPLNTPARQTLASALSPLSLEHGGQARFGLFVVFLHLNLLHEIAVEGGEGKKKKKQHSVSVDINQSFIGALSRSTIPGPKKNISFEQGGWEQVFPLAQTVTEADRQKQRSETAAGGTAGAGCPRPSLLTSQQGREPGGATTCSLLYVDLRLQTSFA